VTESTSLSPVITGLPAFCEGGNTVLNAGTFATYVWSEGSMNQTLNVNSAATYSVTVSDGQGCSGASSVAVVEVAPPSATLRPDVTICNTVAGGSTIDLFSQITSGDTGGSWVDVDNSGASGLFDNLNFDGIAAGNYRFMYTTNSATAPCPENSYSTTVIVIDCACPDVAFLNANDLCNDAGTLDLSTLEQTAELGTWSIISNPSGSNPASLNGTLFYSADADPGVYTLQFTLYDQQPPGCPADFQTTIQVDQQVFAGVPAAPTELCEEEEMLIALGAMLSGADGNGVWAETSAVLSQGGAFSGSNGTFTTDLQNAGAYSFEYTVVSGNVCPDVSASVSVVINP
jgi:hypothetical protein